MLIRVWEFICAMLCYLVVNGLTAQAKFPPGMILTGGRRSVSLRRELARIVPKSMFTLQQFETLLPLACAWASEQELAILRTGVPLTEAEMADARRVGVARPERVRLLGVPEIPMPEHPTLAFAAKASSLITPFTVGLTLQYGIFIHASCWSQRRLVAHELAHTMQYERLGGFEPFLRQYLGECLSIGYPEAPMEQEAIRIEGEVCG
ncbi:hypothetical protein [Zavarzinella formosa]|uniref:hypothetical protein n=1 Tax=Zavarzinella formosa TaxID=360055 RepID=UPI0002ED2C2A|nr:hypothetical protein [Zavarzinella formosa]